MSNHVVELGGCNVVELQMKYLGVAGNIRIINFVRQLSRNSKEEYNG